MLLRSRLAQSTIAGAGACGAYLLARKYYTKKDVTQELPRPLPDPTKFDLPDKIPYLLVGGGTSAHAAMRAIRGHNAEARVLMITKENYSPYMRPALSKELWLSEKETRRSLNFKWYNGKDRSIFFELDEFYLPINDMVTREHGGVSLLKNVSLAKLDATNNTAYLDNGQSIKYDKCLLATGGKPKSSPLFDSFPDEAKQRVIYYKTAEDFLKLDKISDTAESIAILGGGLLGTELAFALKNRLSDDNIPANQMIYQIYSESGCLGKVLPEHLSKHITKLVIQDGVLPIVKVEILEVKWNPTSKKFDIILSNGQIVKAEYIVAETESQPDTRLAKDSQLEVDEKTGGYLVNAELEARSNVYVAGDAACFYDTKLGRRRIEHHDHAVNSGRLAGQNMIGAGKPYTHLPMFWSDLGSHLSFEAVGIIDSSLQTHSVFSASEEEEKSDSSNKNFDKGVVFYLKDDVIVGVLIWNLFSRLNVARRIIHEQKKYEDLNELAKLFDIHAHDEED